MNLILEDAKDCIKYDKTSVPDGEGGYDDAYVPGAPFKATIKGTNDKLGKIAEAITQQVTYQVYTPMNVKLSQGDVIKRVSDNKFFEILFDNSEKSTPKSSAMSFRYTSAKEWKGNVEK